jgi:hypothetical protein
MRCFRRRGCWGPSRLSVRRDSRLEPRPRRPKAESPPSDRDVVLTHRPVNTGLSTLFPRESRGPGAARGRPHANAGPPKRANSNHPVSCAPTHGGGVFPYVRAVSRTVPPRVRAARGQRGPHAVHSESISADPQRGACRLLSRSRSWCPHCLGEVQVNSGYVEFPNKIRAWSRHAQNESYEGLNILVWLIPLEAVHARIGGSLGASIRPPNARPADRALLQRSLQRPRRPRRTPRRAAASGTPRSRRVSGTPATGRSSSRGTQPGSSRSSRSIWTQLYQNAPVDHARRASNELVAVR